VDTPGNVATETCGWTPRLYVVGQSILRKETGAALADHLDAGHGLDFRDRLRDHPFVDRYVVAGIEGELPDAQEDLVDADGGFALQESEAHEIERRAVGDQHRTLVAVAVLQAAKSYLASH